MNEERADAVKEAFEFAWSGYHTYAFPNDDLKPLTNGHFNTRYCCAFPSVLAPLTTQLAGTDGAQVLWTP